MVLSIISFSIGIASVVKADSGFGNFWGMIKGEPKQELTAEQQAEMQAKMDAVNAAINANDYNAWVTAIKAINENSPILQKVTADNFQEYVTKEQERETKMAQQKTLMEKVFTALDAGDYNAWVTAVKAINENSPILSKISAENFNRYVEAYNLQKQANSIYEELGIGKGGFGGPGNGRHGGMMGGPGFGEPFEKDIND